MAYDLENDMFRLLLNEAFFAGISRHISKRPVKNIPTAGVRVMDDGHFEMVYNEEFFEKLPDNQRRGVLKHEM